LNTDLESGLTPKAAHDKLVTDGPNVVSPKQRGYLLTGFNVLYACSLLCWISWEPLGDPSLYNLGLGIIIALISSFFTWFQEHNEIDQAIASARHHGAERWSHDH